MQAVFNHLDFFLNMQESFSLKRAARTAVTVKRGSVWVTQDGKPEDHVLQAGQTLRIHGDETVIVSALSASEIELDEGCRRGVVEQFWRKLKAAYLHLYRSPAVLHDLAAARAGLGRASFRYGRHML